MEINYNQDIAFEKKIHKRKKSKNERKSIRVICKENKKTHEQVMESSLCWSTSVGIAFQMHCWTSLCHLVL